MNKGFQTIISTTPHSIINASSERNVVRLQKERKNRKTRNFIIALVTQHAFLMCLTSEGFDGRHMLHVWVEKTNAYKVLLENPRGRDQMYMEG
jgi:hypothetical protein